MKPKSERLRMRLGWLALSIIGALIFLAWAKEAKRGTNSAPLLPKLGVILATSSGQPPVCVGTKRGLDEALRWYRLGDGEEVVRTFLAHGGGQILRPGTKVKVLEPGISRTKIRVLNTSRECWVIRELIQ